jgi:hypothetical protein
MDGRTAFGVFLGAFLFPYMTYKGCKWQQEKQDRQKYARTGQEYFPE